MRSRQPLHHAPPPFVPDGSWFFLTLCCEPRGHNQLCRPEVASALRDDAVHYHRLGQWHLHLLLLMPDHLHALAAFPRGNSLTAVLRNWKRLTARTHGIVWQRDFFDHRLRSAENLELKARYIRENPVRAGLVGRAEDWPYFVDHAALAGR